MVFMWEHTLPECTLFTSKLHSFGMLWKQSFTDIVQEYPRVAFQNGQLILAYNESGDEIISGKRHCW